MFDAIPVPLLWLAIGILLAVLELIIPGTYLIWFGFAALVDCLITAFIPGLSLAWQLTWFAISSVIFAFIGWKIYGWTIFHSVVPEKYRNLNDPIAQMTGKTVKVVSVKGDKMQVAVGDTVWTATSDDNIKAGDNAVISGSYNNVELKIKKLLDKNKKKR
ncbi:MAG: NfeD family protein [Alphaproteobacteria bacterium]|nr:NfeD family protein [Alphaproteobacteria bacterium]